MNPGDKVKLQQFYKEQTGKSIPDTDMSDFLLSLACSFGASAYEAAISSGWVDEPDADEINDYVEWLQQSLIKLLNERTTGKV